MYIGGILGKGMCRGYWEYSGDLIALYMYKIYTILPKAILSRIYLRFITNIQLSNS